MAPPPAPGAMLISWLIPPPTLTVTVVTVTPCEDTADGGGPGTALHISSTGRWRRREMGAEDGREGWVGGGRVKETRVEHETETAEREGLAVPR